MIHHRATAASVHAAPTRVDMPNDDLLETAKRLRDEGYDPSLSLEDIIALADKKGGLDQLESGGLGLEPVATARFTAGWWGEQQTCLALLIAGAVTRFGFLNWPHEVVFDEVHFGKFIGGYISGRYFFDIHPPFGKLVIAATAYFGGYRATQAFDHIGEPFGTDVNIFALRAGPATFGALIVPLTYLLSRQLGCSVPAALLVAGLVLLDGALLVESRLLLTDSVLFFFEMLQLYAMACTRATPPLSRAWCGWCLLTGLSIACAVSTKWTALATMGIVGLESIRSLLVGLHGQTAILRAVGLHEAVLARHSLWRRHLKALESTRSWSLHLPVLARSLKPVLLEFGVRACCLLLVPLAVYVLTFVLHFQYLPLSGPGDKFHPIGFRCMLDGPNATTTHGCTYRGCKSCEKAQVPSLLTAIWMLNKEMLSANAHIKTGHSFGSGYLSWPINSAPVFYWQQTQNAQWCKIYMAGNPVIWRGALVLCLLMVGLLLHHMASLWMGMPPRYPSAEVAAAHRQFMLNGWLLLVGYLGAWLPFAFVERVAFLYHYIPPLLLTFLGGGIAFDLLTVRLANLRLGRGRAVITGRALLCALLLGLCAATSYYFAPLYYGFPMKPDEQSVRVKRLDTWLDKNGAGGISGIFAALRNAQK